MSREELSKLEDEAVILGAADKVKGELVGLKASVAELRRQADMLTLVDKDLYFASSDLRDAIEKVDAAIRYLGSAHYFLTTDRL